MYNTVQMMHKFKFLYNIEVNMLIYVKKDRYHNPGIECYILNFNGQGNTWKEKQ